LRSPSYASASAEVRNMAFDSGAGVLRRRAHRGSELIAFATSGSRYWSVQLSHNSFPIAQDEIIIVSIRWVILGPRIDIQLGHIRALFIETLDLNRGGQVLGVNPPCHPQPPTILDWEEGNVKFIVPVPNSCDR